MLEDYGTSVRLFLSNTDINGDPPGLKLTKLIEMFVKTFSRQLKDIGM